MNAQPGSYLRKTVDCFTRPGAVQLVNEDTEQLMADYLRHVHTYEEREAGCLRSLFCVCFFLTDSVERLPLQGIQTPNLLRKGDLHNGQDVHMHACMDTYPPHFPMPGQNNPSKFKKNRIVLGRRVVNAGGVLLFACPVV